MVNNNIRGKNDQEDSTVLWKDILINLSIEDIEELFNNNEQTERYVSKYLNNIQLKVLWRNIESEFMTSNKELKEFHKQKNISIGKYQTESIKALHSEKWLNQSSFEFEEECEKILESHGINVKQLAKEFLEKKETSKWLRDLLIQWKFEEVEKIQKDLQKFEEKFMPIYIILRKAWYTHIDLTQ